MEKDINSELRKCLNKLSAYNDAHKEILNRTSGLTTDILLKDLKDASKYKKGYYKNKKGVYIYVKGIEVTNDLADICRMGYNGEDRGVWIHYCMVDDRSVNYIDVPVSTFNITYFNKSSAKPDELLHRTTKEEFEAKVKETVNTLCADYTEDINPNEYHKIIKGWCKLYDEFEQNIISFLPEELKEQDKIGIEYDS